MAGMAGESLNNQSDCVSQMQCVLEADSHPAGAACSGSPTAQVHCCVQVIAVPHVGACMLLHWVLVAQQGDVQAGLLAAYCML